MESLEVMIVTIDNLKICAANIKSVLHSTKMRELVMVERICYLDFEKDVAQH